MQQDLRAERHEQGRGQGHRPDETPLRLAYGAGQQLETNDQFHQNDDHHHLRRAIEDGQHGGHRHGRPEAREAPHQSGGDRHRHGGGQALVDQLPRYELGEWHPRP